MSRRIGGMEYIRRYYHVPAYQGRRVKVKPSVGAVGLVGREGVITSAVSGPYVMVRLDGDTQSLPYHPADLEYLGKVSGAMRVKLTVELDLELRWAIAQRFGHDRPASREQLVRFLDGEITALLQVVRAEYDAQGAPGGDQ